MVKKAHACTAIALPVSVCGALRGILVVQAAFQDLQDELQRKATVLEEADLPCTLGAGLRESTELFFPDFARVLVLRVSKLAARSSNCCIRYAALAQLSRDALCAKAAAPRIQHLLNVARLGKPVACLEHIEKRVELAAL